MSICLYLPPSRSFIVLHRSYLHAIRGFAYIYSKRRSSSNLTHTHTDRYTWVKKPQTKSSSNDQNGELTSLITAMHWQLHSIDCNEMISSECTKRKTTKHWTHLFENPQMNGFNTYHGKMNIWHNTLYSMGILLLMHISFFFFYFFFQCEFCCFAM